MEKSAAYWRGYWDTMGQLKVAQGLAGASNSLFKLLRKGTTQWHNLRGPGGSRTLNYLNLRTRGNNDPLQNALHVLSNKPLPRNLKDFKAR